MGRTADEAPRCFRHPTEPGRRKCYHCHKAICPQCQLRAEGHIFCSEHCAASERRAERWRRLEAWNRSALSGPWFRAALFSALVLMGAAAVWLASHADLFEPSPEPPMATFKRPKERGIDYEKLDWDAPGTFFIGAPSTGAVVRENKVRVSGKAPAEAMVGLYVNGEKVDVQMCPGGSWEFDGVPLTAAKNLIQARYFDNRGNSSYSPAVLVELQTLPARVAPLPAEVPPPPVDLANLTRGPVGQKQVYLTFDGGSTANVTVPILDILKREGVHATIFLTGEYMQRYPDLTRRIAQEGHVVGNHTFSHPHLTTYSFNARQATLSGVTEAFLKSQLQRTADMFQLIVGQPMSHLWRAPFGEFNAQILSWAQSVGFRHVCWTPHLDTLDWVASPSDPLFKSPEQILQGLLKRDSSDPYGLDGGIVLMHLGTERESGMEANKILPQLIESLRAKGYGFATVDGAAKKPAD
jgi:peptidoglycan/xylan/chitin deacetylase (PgdA/CDA1 family)